MAKSRKEIVLGVFLLGVMAIPIALAGLWVFMSTTATTLHPDPAAVPSATAAAPTPRWSAAVDDGRQIVRAALGERNLTGMSVAVGVGGEIAWAEGFGWANLEEKAPVTPTTRFRIGTASMVLTSAAIGLLLDQQKLDLDTPAQTLVPEVPWTEWPMTLRQVMAHVAGIPNDGGDEATLLSKHCERPADAWGFFSGSERTQLFTPGMGYRFSNYGGIVLSAAVETATKARFLDFMWQQVFEPIGMRDTEADVARDPIPRATPYFPRFAADPRYGLHLTRPLDFSCYAGASAFLSTPSDLVRFGMAMNGGTLLRPATVQLLQTPQRLTSGEETGYGLGWDLETVILAGAPAPMVGHEGDVLGGNVASFMIFPERQLVVAVLSNISYADTPATARKIAEAFASRMPPAKSPERVRYSAFRNGVVRGSVLRPWLLAARVAPTPKDQPRTKTEDPSTRDDATRNEKTL